MPLRSAAALPVHGCQSACLGCVPLAGWLSVLSCCYASCWAVLAGLHLSNHLPCSASVPAPCSWAYLPYSMHMAGPREAIQHMIIRKVRACRAMCGCCGCRGGC